LPGYSDILVGEAERDRPFLPLAIVSERSSR
jgi:hypothetical protein